MWSWTGVCSSSVEKFSFTIIVADNYAADRRKFAGDNEIVVRRAENFIIGALSYENWTKSKRNEGAGGRRHSSQKPRDHRFSNLRFIVEFKAKNWRENSTRTSTPRYSWCNAIKGTRRYPDPAGNYECLSRYIIRYFRYACSKHILD